MSINKRHVDPIACNKQATADSSVTPTRRLMSTNAGEIDSNSNGVTADSLDSKTETLAIEPSSGGITVVAQDLVDEVRVSGGELGVVMDEGEKVLDESRSDAVASSVPPDVSCKDSVDEVRVSGDELGIVMDEGEKVSDESRLDAVVSSVPPAVSDEVRIGDELLDSKTETLMTEPSSGGIVVVQDLVDDARVSGGEVAIVMDNVEKVLDESRSDAVASSVPPDVSCKDSVDEVRVSGDELGIVMDEGEKVLDESRLDDVGSSVPPAASDEVKIGDELLDPKTETLVTEPSSGGIVVVQDLVDDARVSGGEVAIVMDNVEKVLDESRLDDVGSSVPPAASVEVRIGDELLDSKTETLVTEPSSGGIVVVQDLVDDARVSGGEVAIVMDNVEKVLDESRSDAVVSSVPPAASDEVKIGDDMLESNSGMLTVETSDQEGGGVVGVQNSANDTKISVVEKNLDKSMTDAGILKMNQSADHDGDGDVVVQDSVDDSRASRDDEGVVMGNIEKVSDENEVNNEEQEGEKVVQDSVNDPSVSVDEIGTVMDKSELVSSEPLSNRDIDTVVEVNTGTDSLGSKTETLTLNPSAADHNKGGDVIVQGSVDDSRVSRDGKGIVTENVEKVSDENEVNIEEKEGEYKVTDIVWAKVKDYPWWPGQILDPSSSTDKAKKHSNKKGLLVGYFGDQSFAWNKPSNIKPFRKNFSKMEKQSNSKAFFHAVDCALDEVSRRVDFGLACSCLSKEVYDKIKSQEFVNAGITKEASKIDGGDRFSTVSSFKPVKVVQSVQELAKEQFDGFDRLEVLSVRTQLSAFFRWKGWKGCYQFQAPNFLDELDNKLEDESKVPLTEENKAVEDEKPASAGKKVSSKKRKSDVSDSDDSEDLVPCKKERSSKNVTPKGKSSVKRSKKDISKKATVEDDVIEEKNGNDSDDSDDSVPHKKERSLASMTQKGSTSVKRSKKDINKKATVKEENVDEKTASGGKKASSKKRKPDACDSDDSEDSVPRKKEKSLKNVTSKGNSSVKHGVSKKATVEDNENEKSVSGGKKVLSKKQKPDVSEFSDSDDSEDLVPQKKEKSLTNLTSKGNSSAKQSISKKATVEDNENEKSVSGGKKVSSNKQKPDVSDSDDSEDSVPRKKEKSFTNLISKGNSSVKRCKQSISRKATVEDNENEKSVSKGKKVTSKKQEPDDSDSDDSEDTVPRKKERSMANVTPKGNSSVKRVKQGISKKAPVEDHENENPVSGGKKVSSKNRKLDAPDSDDSVPRKKEKSLTNKTSKVDSSVKRSKKSIGKKATVEDHASKEDNGNGTSDKKSPNSSPKKLFKVGDRICRIAKQISVSPSILKNETQKSTNHDDDEESS